MTENAFYPLFLVVALALVATLERPTPLRQVGAARAAAGSRTGRARRRSRSSPAAATAPLLLALYRAQRLSRRARAAGRRSTGSSRAASRSSSLGTVARGALAALGARRLPRRDRQRLLGRPRAALRRSTTLAELDLYLGVVPFAALLALWFAPRAATPRPRARSRPPRSRSSVWLVARGRGLRVAARRWTRSRSGTCSTSRRSR